MRNSLRLFLLSVCLAGLTVMPGSAAAGSLGDWFKKLGNSFAHPQKHPTPTRPRPERGRPPEAAALSPTPSPVASPEPTVRVAAVVSGPRNPKRDIPYGIPVADKPGFVTSPYSPLQGWVDVRGIPSGTEVKDPFTGKIFLTP